MWLSLLKNGMFLGLRLDGATRGKWRTLDGKVDVWNVFMFGALKVVVPSCVG
jgi:hypothetical protein